MTTDGREVAVKVLRPEIAEAFARDLTLIDLRLICESDSDFANPIEPSIAGGAKIARAIAQFATGTGVRTPVIPR